MLPSCTVSACLHQCELWGSAAGNVCLVMEWITAQRTLHILPKAMQHTHGAALTQSLKHHFCAWTLGTAFLSQTHVGTPSCHVFMGAGCLKYQSELQGNAPHGKSVFPSPVAFIQEYWGMEIYKWASNGHLTCYVSSSLLASITTGVWAACSFSARQKRLGSHPAHILSCWTAFSHIDHFMHFF